MAISVEDARKLLAAEVEASSLNDVAGRVGIDRSTLRTFVKPGGVQKPIPRVLRPILAYAEKRLASASSAGNGPPPSPAADGTPAGDGGLITIPRDQFFELRGELRGLQRLMLWAAESAMQMHKHLGDAAGGVGDMVASGMFTRPDIPPLPMTRLDPPDDEAEEARRVG